MIRVIIRWPALLDNTCHLKLEVLGSVTESHGGVAVVRIQRYDFRVGRFPSSQVCGNAGAAA